MPPGSLPSANCARSVFTARVQRRLDLRPRRAVVERAPNALLERREVDRARIPRVELDVGDAAGCHGTDRTREDPCKRRTGLPVEAANVAARRRRRRDAADRAAARHGADAANRARQADKQLVVLVERQGTDRAVAEGVAAGNERPRVAAVGRLVDAEAGLGVRGGIRLAGARVNRVTGWIGGVDKQRADRVRAERGRLVLPVDLAVLVGRLVGDPDTAARGAEVERALLGLLATADRHCGHAARGGVLLAAREELVEQRRVLRLVRPDRLPRALAALALQPVVRRERARGDAIRNRVRRICALSLLLSL